MVNLLVWILFLLGIGCFIWLGFLLNESIEPLPKKSWLTIKIVTLLMISVVGTFTLLIFSLRLVPLVYPTGYPKTSISQGSYRLLGSGRQDHKILIIVEEKGPGKQPVSVTYKVPSNFVETKTKKPQKVIVIQEGDYKRIILK